MSEIEELADAIDIERLRTACRALYHQEAALPERLLPFCCLINDFTGLGFYAIEDAWTDRHGLHFTVSGKALLKRPLTSLQMEELELSRWIVSENAPLGGLVIQTDAIQIDMRWILDLKNGGYDYGLTAARVVMEAFFAILSFSDWIQRARERWGHA